jgi:hypothetical protein
MKRRDSRISKYLERAWLAGREFLHQFPESRAESDKFLIKLSSVAREPETAR